MMLLAAGWTWPATVVALAVITGITMTLVTMFGKAPQGLPMGQARFDDIESDLLAIRTDLAEIKATLAEIDRLFKSVG